MLIAHSLHLLSFIPHSSRISAYFSGKLAMRTENPGFRSPDLIPLSLQPIYQMTNAFPIAGVKYIKGEEVGRASKC